MTASFYLDRRHRLTDGSFRIRLRVYHDRAILFSTPFKALENEWQNGSYAPKAPNAQARNVQLREMLNKVERVLFADDVPFLSGKVLRQRIEEALMLRTASAAPTLLTYMSLAREGLSPRTFALYKWAADRVIGYDATVRVNAVTDVWLRGFVAHLRAQGLAPNSIVLLLSYVKRGCAEAVRRGALPSLPFHEIKVKGEATRKRSLPVEAMRELRDMPLTGHRAWARDMFLLSFYLLGMNIADMYDLRELVDGRIEYKRRKTGTLYSVAVPPEAMEIIDRYRGKDGRLLDFSRFSSCGTAVTVLDYNLARIRPKLSTYYARHSWATYAAELEIPIETISHALGHRIGSPITAIYVAFNQKKVDEANRRVIAYLNAEKKPSPAE